MTGWERATGWPGVGRADVRYGGPAAVPYPVPPFQVWGLAYDLDLVVVSRHPGWNMHEYARLRTPDGPLWLCKDAREPDLSQSIVADLPGIERWLPEVPVQRKHYPVEVVDRSTAHLLDLELRYENIDGEPVSVAYRGRPPTSPQSRRNGSTMGHSRDTVLAVLDVSHRDFARSARVEIGGRRYGVARLAGLVPFRMALQQVQGGLSVGRMVLRVDGAGFSTTHDVFEGEPVEQVWTVRREDAAVVARQDHRMRALAYRFADQGPDTWELVSATVSQWGRATPTVHVELHPPLPDLRRPFEGTARSRYVVDVNGQPGHAVGWMEASSGPGGARVDVLPEAPWWTADRPMRTSVAFLEGTSEVRVERVTER